MFEALLDPVVDDVHEERVRTERGGDEVTHTGVSRGGLGGKRRDVTVPVIAGPRGNTVRSRPFPRPRRRKRRTQC